MPGVSSRPSVNVSRRPFSSVMPRAIGLHPLCSRISRITVTPAAGSPIAVSSTCVVIICRVRESSLAKQLGQPYKCNLPLLLGCDSPFLVARVCQALMNAREHLVGALAGGADDEDEAKAGLVLAVRGVQPGTGRGRRRRHAALL